MEAKECDNLLFYLIGELPEPQAKSFKSHLKDCQSCLQELDELQDTWISLSYDREDKEAPKSLKVDVMSHIFEKQEQSKSSLSRFLTKSKNSLRKFVTPLKAGVMIGVVLVFLVGLGWDGIHQNSIISYQKPITSQEPDLIKHILTLQSKNSSGKASGVVYIVDEGKSTRLIMHVNHIPELKGKEVYQAWLLYDGGYWNCGTFQYKSVINRL